jgi:hypothetical protein
MIKYYQVILKRLISFRDYIVFLYDPIIPDSLIIYSSINQKNKLYLKWDNPFVILISSNKYIYQLISINNYIIRNLINKIWIRKLSLEKYERYTDEFWEISKRLRSQDLNTQYQ